MLQKAVEKYKSSFFFEKIQISNSWKNVLSVLLLLCLCNIYAYHALSKQYKRYSFYQTEFAPAVMYACGYEFLNPENDIIIKSFLDNRKAVLNCSEIEKGRLKPLSAFQQGHKNLIFSAGVIWKIFGVGWKNLIPLFMILYSATTLATYSIFRLAMRRSLSFLLTVCAALSSLQLTYLLQLRDYSVAPFVLWLIWIISCLVIKTPTMRRSYILSALAGCLIGVGLSFRCDLLILIPYFLIGYIFFVKKQTTVISKLYPLFVFIICMVMTNFSFWCAVFDTNVGGGSMPHVIVLGLADEFTQRLGLNQPETYSIMPLYRDLNAYSIINGFAKQMFDLPNLLAIPSKDYEHFGGLFLLKYLSYYPADFLVRIYASIKQTLILSFDHEGTVFSLLKAIELPLVFFSLILIALKQVRIALFILFSILYICAYPVLQFGVRHYFYLSFVGWIFIGLSIEYCFSIIKNKKSNLSFNQNIISGSENMKIVFFIVAAFLIISYGLLIGTRFYQRVQLINLYSYYQNLPSKKLSINKDVKQFKVLISANAKPNNFSFETIYMKVITEECLKDNIVLNLHYSEEPDASWTAPHEIILSSRKRGVYFFPIYNFHNPGPDVINLNALPSRWINYLSYAPETQACIESINVVDVKRTSILPYLNLQDEWSKTKLYQTLS